MVNKFIRNKAIGIGVTAGVIMFVAYALKKSNAGDSIMKSLSGLGQNVGEGITKPFTGILEGLSIGGDQLNKQAAKTGADFQEAITGNRNAIKDFFENNDLSKDTNDSGQTYDEWQSESKDNLLPSAFGSEFDFTKIFEDIDRISARPTNIGTNRNPGVPQANRKAANVSSFFSDKAITNRYANATSQKNVNFGGYGNFAKQETALRDTIRENQRKYPEWFS